MPSSADMAYSFWVGHRLVRMLNQFTTMCELIAQPENWVFQNGAKIIYKNYGVMSMAEVRLPVFVDRLKAQAVDLSARVVPLHHLPRSKEMVVQGGSERLL